MIRPGVRSAGRAPDRRTRGGRARREGRRAEWWCALWLMLRGYRLLGFRLKTPQAEIDILALRDGVVAVIEVKRRRTLGEALEAVGAAQRRRLIAAAGGLAARRPDLAAAPVRLDLIALAPGRLPRHIPDAWRDA
ncbi:MAG: YraN family protein [Alphaproteobacteria bacterium]|nr:YraN family protein [Alphaproteobacteria bacterium]